MIRYKEIKVQMSFDSGVFKNKILVFHPRLEYPGLDVTSKEDKKMIINIESTIAIVVNELLSSKKVEK